MGNSTPTYWEVDGVSLQTFAFDIETVGGDRLAPPPLRGDDLVIPHRMGDYWMPKQVDSRVLTLGMWVVGSTEDGFAPSGSAADQWDANFRKLRNLLWTPRRRIQLTKRFRVDGQTKVATAVAQYNGGLSPTMQGRTRGVFTVDLKLNDPYFYGPQVTTALPTGTTPLTVEGDAPTADINVRFNGSRNNPRLRNNSMGIEFTYGGPLNAGDYVDIDVKNFDAQTKPSATAIYNSSSRVTHSGDPNWLLLQPGANSLVHSSTTGSGTTQIQHRPAWI